MRRRLVFVMALAALAVPAVPVVSVASASSAAPASAAPLRVDGTVGTGFTDSLVALADTPVAVTALPDGGAVVLEKAGQARVIRNGSMLSTPALTLAVCTESERGLLGFAVDPSFALDGFVYVYYTRSSPSAVGGCVNRVSRFTMHGNVIAPSSERVLIDNIGSPGGNHNGGDLAVGNDGFLYVSVGDGGCDIRRDHGCAGGNHAAQDLSLLNGKILRVDRATGAAAPGNPFTGAGTAACRVRGNLPSTPLTFCREIYAYGLRNPWRIAFDPNTGGTRFFIDDVGQDTREEVDLGVLGANYGWPFREGFCPQGQNPPCPAAPIGYRNPLTDYPHSMTVGGEYITGGAFVPNGAWPKAFDGGYLFADGNPGRIWFRNAAGKVDYSKPFATDVGSISDIGFVSEASGYALYYVLPGSGEVRRIAPSLPATPTSVPLFYASTTPTRMFDSRLTGAKSGPVRGGTSRLVKVAATRGNHRAALVNITIVAPRGHGVVSAWQPRTRRPLAAALTSPGITLANATVVPIDADGNVLVHTTVTTHLVVDLIGFFDVDANSSRLAGRFVSATLVKPVDTRSPSSATNAYSTSATSLGTVVHLPVVGHFGVSTDASAVAVLVTARSGAAASAGNVVVYPRGAATPGVSNVNVNGAHDQRSNLVVVKPGAGGAIDLRLHGVASVSVEVIGWFTSGASGLSYGGQFVLLPSARTVDTRAPLGFHRLAAGAVGGVNPPAVPDTARAVIQTITMVAPAAAGAVTSYGAGGSPSPNAGVHTTGAARSASGTTLTRVGAGGALRYRTSVATDLVVDITGYFLPVTPA